MLRRYLDAEVHEIRTVRGCCRLRGGGRKQAQGCEADNPEDERLQKSSWLHLILLSKSTRHRIKTRGFPPLAHVGFGVIKFWEPEPTWERALPRSGLQLRIETTVYALPRRGRILLPVPCGCQVKFFLDSDGTRKEVLPPGHLLSHVQTSLRNLARKRAPLPELPQAIPPAALRFGRLGNSGGSSPS